MKPSQIKKWNEVKNMVKIGIPGVVWCYFGEEPALAFQAPLERKKRAVENILSLQFDLQNFVDNFGTYRFDAENEVKVSLSTPIVPRHIYSNERKFVPLKGGALNSIHKILVTLYQISETWIASKSRFEELYSWVFHGMQPGDPLSQFIFDFDKKKGGISYAKWCVGDFALGKQIVSKLQEVSGLIVYWMAEKGSKINFTDGNTAKKRAGLKNYVQSVMDGVESPYVMRFVLTHGCTEGVCNNQVKRLHAVWTELVGEKKDPFWEKVKGFVWKIEVVGEAEKGVGRANPIWGVQLVLIFDHAWGVSYEREITLSLWKTWFKMNLENFPELAERIPDLHKPENLTPCKTLFSVYSVLVSQSKILELKKSRRPDSLAECLHGEFNKKNRRAVSGLNYLLDYFVISDIVFPSYGNEEYRQSVKNSEKKQGYERKLKMFGRGQVHKKHNPRSVKEQKVKSLEEDDVLLKVGEGSLEAQGLSFKDFTPVKQNAE